ncbi:unnamed protein product [Tilletia caries]|nr:unnamed protein product [Tilletia caries]
MEPLLVAGDLLSVRNTLAVQDAGKFEDEGSVHRLDKVWPISGPWHMLQSWLYLIFKTHFAASKSGKDGCLDRVREILRRGRTALREDKPLFNEAWEFGQEVWEGRLQAMLEAAQLVNRRGAPGEFEGADHYQETLNKEVQRADTSRSSHHVLDRLEDRLSAVAEQARVVKESIAKGWNVPLFHRNKTTKADQIDIAQIKRVSVDTHLFTIVAGRTIGPSSRAEEGGATARKETAKAAARKDAEHEVGSFQLADPLMRGYVKLRKGALGKWQGRNSGMEIRQLLLETLAEDDEADYDALTSGADDGQAAAAGSRVVERYRRDRGAVRMEELWEESNGVHDE